MSLSPEKQDEHFYEFIKAYDEAVKDYDDGCGVNYRECAAIAFYGWISRLQAHFLRRDESAHRFLVPESELEAFEAWSEMSPSDPYFIANYDHFWSMRANNYELEAYVFDCA